MVSVIYFPIIIDCYCLFCVSSAEETSIEELPKQALEVKPASPTALKLRNSVEFTPIHSQLPPHQQNAASMSSRSSINSSALFDSPDDTKSKTPLADLASRYLTLDHYQTDNNYRIVIKANQ